MWGQTRSKLLEVVLKMPPLRHSLPGKPFDIKKSEVIQWLINQPDILNFLWNHMKQDCIYDSNTGKWKGVDYED